MRPCLIARRNKNKIETESAQSNCYVTISKFINNLHLKSRFEKDSVVKPVMQRALILECMFKCYRCERTGAKAAESKSNGALTGFLFLAILQSHRKPEGGLSFTCQHGPRECAGNMVQACGLSNLLTDHDLRVKFVGCLMTSTDAPSAGPKVRK
jgi:Gamma interferon inducible lysosomal thiol reductase (GILT)